MLPSELQAAHHLTASVEPQPPLSAVPRVATETATSTHTTAVWYATIDHNTHSGTVYPHVGKHACSKHCVAANSSFFRHRSHVGAIRIAMAAAPLGNGTMAPSLTSSVLVQPDNTGPLYIDVTKWANSWIVRQQNFRGRWACTAH
jgi:hypothetical protein